MSSLGSKPLCAAPLNAGVVLVDEAAQLVEADLAIVLARLLDARTAARPARLAVMVGDPQQLPATVFSAAAKAKGYSRSAFWRLQRLGRQVVSATRGGKEGTEVGGQVRGGQLRLPCTHPFPIRCC